LTFSSDLCGPANFGNVCHLPRVQEYAKQGCPIFTIAKQRYPAIAQGNVNMIRRPPISSLRSPAFATTTTIATNTDVAIAHHNNQS